jgi:peptide/nickel transport system substrate-binding protein
MLRFRAHAAVLALAALAFGASPAEAKPFRFAVSGDANTMDPHSQNAGNVTLVLRQIYEPLIHRGKKLEKIPGLATSWRSVEPNRWRFELRRGVKFHDGPAFTADDVVFSIKRALAPTSNYGIFVDTVADAVKVDTHTVDIVTKIPDPILPNKLTSVFIMSQGVGREEQRPAPAEHPRARGDVHRPQRERHRRLPPYRARARRAHGAGRNEDWWGWQDKAPTTAATSPRSLSPDLLRRDAHRGAAVGRGRLRARPAAAGPEAAEAVAPRARGPEVRTIFFALDMHRDELLYANVKGKNPFKDVRVRRRCTTRSTSRRSTAPA